VGSYGGGGRAAMRDGPIRDRAVSPAPPPYRRPWSLMGLLDHLFGFCTVTLLGGLLSILLEWAGLAFGWWDPPGVTHSQRLLRTELDWLGQDFAGPGTVAPLVEGAYRGAGLLYHWSGLEGLMRWAVADQPSGWPGLELIRVGLRQGGEYLLAAAYITQLVGARLAMVLLALPAFALLGLMGAIDGLVRRDLRRFGGGAESGFMYHHLKKMLRPMISVPVFFYLIWPWSVHPTWVFVPAALGLGYFAQRTLARFKKYL